MSAQDKSGTVFVVEEQSNPSTDFFVLPVVSRAPGNIVRCNFAELPAPAELAGAVVVFIRYVPTAWMRLIESVRPTLRALVFFMDDDVLDVGASAGMPLRYRYKLWRLSARRREWLQSQRAQLWVSTQYLQHKYSAWKPGLILPSPLSLRAEVCRVFYHGSASHDAEIRWLRPVMEEVLRRNESVVFELIGGQDVYRLYRGLPRVNVVHPMKWPAYQAFIAMPGRHVGLAPLMEIPFNRARSYTKFFDITNCGAAGVYSPNGAYSGVVENGVEGLIAPLRQEAWVSAILELAQNELLRQRILRNAEVKSKRLEEEAFRCSAGMLK